MYDSNEEFNDLSYCCTIRGRIVIRGTNGKRTTKYQMFFWPDSKKFPGIYIRRKFQRYCSNGHMVKNKNQTHSPFLFSNMCMDVTGRTCCYLSILFVWTIGAGCVLLCLHWYDLGTLQSWWCALKWRIPDWFTWILE